MHRFQRAALFIVLLAFGLGAPGQTFIELRQDATRYNLESQAGAPISDKVGVPTGSDGRAPGSNPGPIGTARQFQSVLVFGGLVVPKSAALVAGQSYAANAETINLP